MWRKTCSSCVKVLAPLVPLAIAACIATRVVAGDAAITVRLIAMGSLLASAFLVLILRLESFFCFGFCCAAWGYFGSLLPLLFPPSGAATVYLLPTAWTVVGLYYRPDQYWPDAPLYDEFHFALGDALGSRLLAAAHSFWTLVFGLAGGIAAVGWQKGNPLYVDRRNTLVPPRSEALMSADVLLFLASCGLIAYLFSGWGAEMAFLAVLGFAVLVLFAGTKCAWGFVALCGLGNFLHFLLFAVSS